jgi:DNA ligase-1
MTLSTLYKLTSTGKTQMWEIKTVDNFIFTSHGQVGGKIQTVSEEITEGKNIGKANETTPIQQAEAEAQQRWEKKAKKGYVTEIADAADKKVDTNYITGGVDPMLAHSFDKQGHKIVFPAFVQPKLDGHRCIAIISDGKATLWSRTRKRIHSMPHIVAQLENVFPKGNCILDGELYNHEYRDSFEKLTSLIRQEKPAPGHEVVQYWIYDVVEEKPFKDREFMLTCMEGAPRFDEAKSLKVLATFEVEDEEDMVTHFNIFMENGFEGAIVRNAAGIYKGKRSYDLQKVKEFADSEFEIIGVEEGRGKMKGCAIFVCKTDAGGTFRVKCEGSLDNLATMYDERDKYVGKQLTVKYQGITNAEGVPRFPIGIRVREDV